MGILSKFKEKLSRHSSIKENSTRSTIIVSEDKGYQEQAKRHTEIHNQMQIKSKELEGLTNIKHSPLPKNSTESLADIYAKNELKQKEGQKLIKESFHKCLNQRQIFTNVIQALINKHPERQEEFMQIIQDCEKELLVSPAIAEDRKLIFKGVEPGFEMDPSGNSKLYDISLPENASIYIQLFKEPMIELKKKN